MRLFGLLGTVAGSVLVVLSFAWTSMFPATDRWSDEQAKEYSRAAAKLHQLHHSVKGHPQALTAPPGKSLPKATQADLDAAQRDYDEKRADFDLARSSSSRTAQLLRWSGVGIALVGVVATWFDRQRRSKGRLKRE